MPIVNCEQCGQEIDETQVGRGVHGTVERVVRPGHRFGGIRGADTAAGARVAVEARFADRPNVLEATMSLEEWEAVNTEALERVRAEKPKPGLLKGMVERGLAAARAEVVRAIEEGKRELARPPRVGDAERVPGAAE
jgi:hypothetical protein